MKAPASVISVEDVIVRLGGIIALDSVTFDTLDGEILGLIGPNGAGKTTFFNITTPKVASRAIRKAHESGWKQLHFLNNLSASMGSVIEPAGFEAGQGIITTAYMMDPTDPQWADNEECKAWSAFMDAHFPDGDKTSSFTAYGWSACNTLLHTLQSAGGNYNRESIMKAAASIKEFRAPLLLQGITVATSATDFYPIEAKQLQRVEGETWALFGDVISAESE